MDEKALKNLVAGVSLIAVKSRGKTNGCVANTAVQISITPIKISITLGKSLLTTDLILKEEKFSVNVFNKNVLFDTIKNFGYISGRNKEKFENYKYNKFKSGNPYLLKEVNSVFDCVLENTVDVGTHYLFIGKVVEMKIVEDIPSITYQEYIDQIKDVPKGVVVANLKEADWLCLKCGFKVKTKKPAESYICPICKATSKNFKRV